MRIRRVQAMFRIAQMTHAVTCCCANGQVLYAVKYVLLNTAIWRAAANEDSRNSSKVQICLKSILEPLRESSGCLRYFPLHHTAGLLRNNLNDYLW